ncbi:MAG: tetratricopeptide repeat protein [Candidatus Aegiribacteria sp.]|nr:tetratricopeptide repeat protein [Candidatus Aegiribacteria sp.]
MLRLSIASILVLLMFTGCFGFWVRTPEEIENIDADQQRMQEDIDSLARAVEDNEVLLRGLQAQSGNRAANLVNRLTALADELDLALMRLNTAGGATVQDTTTGPDAQLLYNEAYRQFQQGSFEISAQGFLELHDRYPSSSLADDALYYMAICWEEAGQSHKAIEDLVALYYMYPNSEWAPGAIFRAADIYDIHGAPGERDRLFDLLLNKYPGSDESALVRELHPD